MLLGRSVIFIILTNKFVYFFRVRNSSSVTEIELSDWLPRGPYGKQVEE